MESRQPNKHFYTFETITVEGLKKVFAPPESPHKPLCYYMDSLSTSNLATLRSIPELSEVPDSQLDWLLAHSKIRNFQAGEIVFKPDILPDEIYLIMVGTVNMLVGQGENKSTISQYHKGGILGYFPYNEEMPAYAYGQAATDLKLISYPRSKIQNLISHHRELTDALVRILMYRTKKYSAETLQNEKILALGKLSAGLSHELNHPIASIQRDTSELERLFNGVNLIKIILCNSGLDTDEISKLQDTVDSWMRAERTTGMAPSEILTQEKLWLENLTAWGMQNPDEAAEIFTDSGLDLEEVRFWVNKIGSEKVDAWLYGIQFLLQGQALVKTAQNASEKIRTLIHAVKTFTHVERGVSTLSKLDPVKSIEDTLIILSHKLKKFNVQVVFSKPKEPVFMFGYPSELNQVWTNLIDNAIDALEKKDDPKLEITILPEESYVSVLITDNGSAISDDIKARIFEPFFTTKGIGKGSGLGLDLVNQIILKHGGKIHVDSVPGQTTFRLEFPNT